MHVLSRSYLTWSDRTATATGVVRVKGILGSSAGPQPTGTVQLQQSPNGTTGWTTVAAVPTTSNGTFYTWRTLAQRVGYLRLCYPANADATAASSRPFRIARAVTRIDAFNADPEPLRKGELIIVTGTLQAEAGAPPLVGQQYVQIHFRARGELHSTRMGTVRTGKVGAFAARFPAQQDGTWSATWAAGSDYFNAVPAGDYVGVR